MKNESQISRKMIQLTALRYCHIQRVTTLMHSRQRPLWPPWSRACTWGRSPWL